MGQGFPGHPGEKEQGAVGRGLPQLLGGILGVSLGRAPGVVHHNVDLPEVGGGAGHQLRDGFLPVQVAGEGKNIGAGGGADFVGGAFQVGGGAGADGHARAFLGQGFGAGPAQPLAGAAHDGDFPVQLQVHSEASVNAGGIIAGRGAGE